MLSENRDMLAAKRFFTKAFTSPHNQFPPVITLDKNPAYPPTIQELINEMLCQNPHAEIQRSVNVLLSRLHV
ncbi:DDE-type integrase/transposase/recombinase [Paenibacillus sp. N3.4]|nr:DDE-type integrase/transposase/recombinase [Paenibacillus sp. N3.4]